MNMLEHGASHQTHEVINQPPPLVDYNVYQIDAVLGEAVKRWDAAWAEPSLVAFGERCGREDFIHQGFLANKFTPELKTHDRFGHRIDEVEFHPAYHQLMAAGVEAEVHALPWNHDRAGAHVARAINHYLLTQVEAGVGCPLTMTFAAVPALQLQPDVARDWVPRITSTTYDPRFRPASDKRGALMGMAMTEKQGGSDVRANTTRAVRSGDGWLLTGHKWFCSAPMNDAFLTLAQTDKGLSCFLVARWLDDGTRNGIRIQRLKNKLGNKANASSEIEYDAAYARMVGEEGRGVPTIIEMVNHTRLDCMLGSSALMRQALTQAVHHARHRQAFGKLLSEQPLMRNVLCDLALEWEAAMTLALRMAHAYDVARHDTKAEAFVRIGTAIGKYWVCKRGPAMVYEALECLGGAGYVEESIMPRLYREIPLSSIWEGSGNVMCLDVLRAISKERDTVPALLEELTAARGANRHFDAHLERLRGELGNTANVELRARRLVEQMALALQASLLLRHAPTFVAEAFCASRLGPEGGHEYGTLPPSVDFVRLLERAFIA
jgi:putative acyl-CoA dehydrogenase